MIDKYQRIRDALAMGPTPGPLFVVNGTDVFTALGSPNAQGTHSDEDDGWHVADCLGGETYVNGELVSLTYGESKANAHFFAACDPDTIRGLLAERDALRAKTSLSLGVGDGAGNLFVYGDHDSIMRVQALIFECEKLRERMAEVKELLGFYLNGGSNYRADAERAKEIINEALAGGRHRPKREQSS